MKKYESPKLELQNFETSDIMTLSGIKEFLGSISNENHNYVGDSLDFSDT